MKTKIIVCLLFLGISSTYSQKKSKLNSSNYYNYFVNFQDLNSKSIQGRSLSTNWLKLNEVIPFIMNELKKNGHKDISDNELVKINDNQSIVISVYSHKSNFGFLYIEGHTATPNREHRIERTQKKSMGVEYIYWKETSTGEYIPIKIEKLPKNIFVLNENCYWYQSTENYSDQKKLVTKEDAFNILKEDIKSYLLKLQKK